MRKSGISLTEILVAVFILSIVSITFYEIMTRANHARMLAEARSEAQREAGRILALMQSDFSQARQGTFRILDEGGVKMKVNKPCNDKDENVELRYDFSKPVLKRYFDGRVWQVGWHVEDIMFNEVPGATGQVVIDLTTAVWFPGMRDDETQKHSQRQMVVLREDMASTRDPHWRDVGDVGKFFQTQGNLLAGLKEDADRIVQDFSQTLEGIAADIENATAGQLQKAKQSLVDGINRAKNQLADLDNQILGLSHEAIFDMGGSAGSRIWGGISGRTKRLKEKAAKMRDKLAAMKTAKSMNWQEIMNIAGSDKGRMRQTMRKMFEGKEELFKAGRQIIDAMDNLKITADPGDGIDRTIWSLGG